MFHYVLCRHVARNRLLIAMHIMLAYIIITKE